MNIYIDITSIQNSRGKCDYYWPTTHWELNECDTKSVEQMNALAEDLNKVLREHLTGKKKLKIEVVEGE
jgi:hypothetical protein